MNPKKEVPRVEWEQLHGRQEAGRDSEYMVYRGFLDLGRAIVPVVYKLGHKPLELEEADFMDEAQILLALEGVNDVPRLHGLTLTRPFALVMSVCPGFPIQKFQRPSTGRTYLAALRQVCLILGKVHRKGIIHGDISGITILVEATGNTEVVTTSLVGFDHAVFSDNKQELKKDSRQVMELVNALGAKLRKNTVMYEHRQTLLTTEDLNLTGIVKLLCRVLHGGDPRNCAKCKNLRPGN